jgi:competence protein ComEC
LCAQLPARWLLLLFGVLLVGGWRAERALEQFEVRRSFVRDVLGEPRRCAGHGQVKESPVVRGETLRSIIVFSSLDCEGRTLEGPVRARLYGGPTDLTRDSHVFVVAKLGAVRLFRNVGPLDPTPFAARKGVTLSGSALSTQTVALGSSLLALVDRARAWVRGRIRATFATPAQPMARALVLGENDLSDSDDEAFRKSGLSHLLAVSGTHLVFAVVAVVAALRALLLRIYVLSCRIDVTRLASALGALMAIGYADFSGGSGSAWRAAWMLVVVFLARALRRRPDPARVVGLTVLLGALTDPLVCFDISFMLSLAATGGLLVLGQPLVVRCNTLRFRALRYAAVSLAATVASMLPCAPLLALISPDLTVAGLLANVVAAPIGELVALPVCLSHAIAAPLPDLETGLALVGSGALLAVRRIALVSADIEALAFPIADPTRWQLASVVVSSAALLLCVSRRQGQRFATRAVGAFALGAGLLLVEHAPRSCRQGSGLLRVHMLDVGQGDATLVELPERGALLFDAGGFVGSPVDPGARAIVPWLRAQRRQRLSVLALSHPHPDHFGGLSSVVRAVEIAEFWDTGQGEVEGAGPAYRELLELLRERRVPILRPRALCGRPRWLEGVKLEVLAPCPGFVPGRDANDNSLVVKLTYKNRSFLLTGDAEAHQEAELLQRYGNKLRADVLKVGHHGSRTSTTSEFLARVAPRFATISCGVRNRFGHPHPKTLATLAAGGVVGLRVDRFGSLAISTDGYWLDVHAYSFPR